MPPRFNLAAQVAKLGGRPRKRGNPENAIQQAIVDYIAVAAPQVLCFAIPNGSRRTVGGRASNAVPGLTPGIPDLCCICPGGVAHFLEVKCPGKTLSGAQVDIFMRLTELECKRVVVRSIDDVREAFKRWNIATRECHNG